MIMDKKVLAAEKRKIQGRKVKSLRSQGIVPANVFGKKVKSEAVQVILKDFDKIYKEVGETGLVELKIGTDVRPVLIHELQRNPKTDDILHVDFLQVDLKEKVEAEVPVELTGESLAEKQALGTVVQYINEVKVEALPTDLPEKFVVDISNLSEVDQAIYVKDLKIDRSKVGVKNGDEEIVVKVEPPQKEEVVEAPPAPTEGEVVPEGEVVQEGVPFQKGQPSEEGSKDEPQK